MAEAEDILALIERHRDKWYASRPPPTAEKIGSAEQAVGVKFVEDYRRVLEAYDGGELVGDRARVLLFHPEQLCAFNPDLETLPELAEMLIFGSDSGGYFYFFDHRNKFGKGAWAVFAVSMGMRGLADSFIVADDLHQLFAKIADGQGVIDDGWARQREAKT
jgi:hypothetical protein